MPGRIALMLGGAMLGVLFLEGVLQVGAVALRWRGNDAGRWHTGDRRVLCLGDSNTYGLWLADRSAAYPQTFERLWNAGAHQRRIEVLNAGYPGTNSSRLLHALPGMLDAFQPDVVMVLVGSNDYWTAPVALAPPGAVARLATWVSRHSRVYQLAYMLRRAHAPPVLQVEYDPRRPTGALRYGDATFEMGYQPSGQTPAAYRERLAEHLRAIVATIRDAGAIPILLTYGSRMWNYGEASEVIRRVAGETGTRLVDAGAALQRYCPHEPCPAVLYADHHPTAEGYRHIAETLVHDLGDEL